MTLSTKATNKLADTLAEKVKDRIYQSEVFIDMMHDMVPNIIQSIMGEVDDDVLFEVSMSVMDRIFLTTLQPQDTSEAAMWEDRYKSLFRYVKKTYAESYIDGAEYGTLYGLFGESTEVD